MQHPLIPFVPPKKAPAVTEVAQLVTAANSVMSTQKVQKGGANAVRRPRLGANRLGIRQEIIGGRSQKPTLTVNVLVIASSDDSGATPLLQQGSIVGRTK